MMYEYADKAIRAINRKNLKMFQRLKQMKFDELNILNEISKIYTEAVRYARKWYLLIAKDAYEKVNKKKNPIDKDWILDMLEEEDPVTLYLFTPEIDRKKARLAEALAAALNKGKEVDKALRLLTLQLAHYADKSVDEARLQAFVDLGVKHIIWRAEHDEKTCSVCKERDGKKYPINDIPPKPHLNCRCWYEMAD